MLKRQDYGLTLIELLIVIVIIAILAALAIPTFTKTVETAKDREAWTNLRLIRTGEKIYRLESPYYYPYPGEPTESDIADINVNLKLQLDPEVAWDYEISSQDTGNDFRATAERLNPPTGYDRTWYIQRDGNIGQE